MWIMLNNAFLSIVDPAAAYGGGGPRSNVLLVRARLPGDIEAVFPLAAVTKTPNRDYLYRATVSREDVKLAMAAEVERIDYSNFKGSVPERARHDAYADCWTVMNRLQRWGVNTGGRKHLR